MYIACVCVCAYRSCRIDFVREREIYQEREREREFEIKRDRERLRERERKKEGWREGGREREYTMNLKIIGNWTLL